MKIEGLIKSIKSKEFKGISCDSGAVRDGFIFLAVKGSKIDASRFIKEALANGACAIVCGLQARVPKVSGIFVIRVKDTRMAAAQLASKFYGNPSGALKVIGVTGTCGKTTVTYILEAILKEAGFNPAVIGTVNYRFNRKVLPAKNTTPGPLQLQGMMAKMVEGGVNYLAMEVSSHALDQARVSGIKFSSAIFTNLTQDHLDYHKTLNNYFQAKAKLFKSLSRGASAVLNCDDRYYPQLKSLTRAKIVTYGLGLNAQVRAENIQYGLRSTKFSLAFAGRRIEIKTALIGKHNIYNILAAFAWAHKEGLSVRKVKKAIEGLRSIPGRLEPVSFKKGLCVYVDYAHTEDALKNALSSLKALCRGRIITVFGCGGERDALKRPKMGMVAASLSDFVIITNDNPRSEDPAAIIKDIEKGIESNNYIIIPDRKKAIREALLTAKKGDIVVVAGKGHENYQVLRGKVINFDDRQEIRLCLKSMS